MRIGCHANDTDGPKSLSSAIEMQDAASKLEMMATYHSLLGIFKNFNGKKLEVLGYMYLIIVVYWG